MSHRDISFSHTTKLIEMRPDRNDIHLQSMYHSRFRVWPKIFMYMCMWCVWCRSCNETRISRRVALFIEQTNDETLVFIRLAFSNVTAVCVCCSVLQGVMVQQNAHVEIISKQTLMSCSRRVARLQHTHAASHTCSQHTRACNTLQHTQSTTHTNCYTTTHCDKHTHILL